MDQTQDLYMNAIRQAARILRAGGVIAFPTETVYGLGADALNPAAIAQVFELKGRPRFDPLIVHVPNLVDAKALVSRFPRKAEALAERFWPGPLTLVLEKAPHVPDIVTAGLPRVGLRVPAHPMALDLLLESRIPIAAPSANPFGKVSPTCASHVKDSFGDRVPVLDGGPCLCGIESTVLLVASEEAPPVLLRPGAISLELLQETVGPIRSGDPEIALRPPAPGMLARHYSPETPLYLDPMDPPSGRLGWLGLGVPSDPDRFTVHESLSVTNDLPEAAANLFGALRRLDGLGLDAIWAQSAPELGIGRAINDRLRRASARRASP